MKKYILAFLVGASMLIAAPANADLHRPDGADTKIFANEARTIANKAGHIFLLAGFPPPKRVVKVDRCIGGEYVWRCKAIISNYKTRCDTIFVVWSEQGAYYIEWRNLTCKTTRS